MILDNENKNFKVHEWISSFTEEGRLDIVTGYFTIGALAWLSNEINSKISDYRFVLGDIVNISSSEEHPLDLLNENITIEASLKLSKLAKEAVAFLKQNNVSAKTLEPNFCHAKSYIFTPAKNDDRNKYFISGSSNLTEAGIGQKITSNIELNIAETGNNNQYKEMADWFETLWNKPQAHNQKTIISSDGVISKIDFKQYLINEIEQVFIKYSPRELYFKVLFEIFGNQLIDLENDVNFNRQLGKLENSVVFNLLYEFQKKGVLSLIRMLQKFNGAILADAVGLGKTWSALAVIKFFQLQGREIIVLCPKKLEHNWRRYLKNQDARFEKDQFDYFIRYHTDLDSKRMEKYVDRGDKLFSNDKPKLLVIDESHNLRNDKSGRYKFLVEKILKYNDDIKVLLLSATPINNSLNDIRNQFKLMVKGNIDGFNESLNVRNLDYSFRTAQKVFNDWRQELSPRIADFTRKLPANFFTLTDSLIVARTRKMVEGEQMNLSFPLKAKPINLFVTPRHLGNFESFEELFDHFPPMLSGYQPAFYLEIEKDEEKNILHDERQRDRFLVKMMYILMVKRLESSWSSFFSTVEKIKLHHENVLEKIRQYQAGKQNMLLSADEQILLEDDELIRDFEDLYLGKKRKISLLDIDSAGNLNAFKKDLKKDLDSLDHLFVNLEKFKGKIEKEILVPNNQRSTDDKLEALIQQINIKRASGYNNGNLKLVIFTVYKDTAEYLYSQLKERGFNRLAMVSGSGSLTSDSDKEVVNFEPILERFAPYTKLFKEREWGFQTAKSGIDAYHEWIEWISINNSRVNEIIQNPIDILIATDALSEGQNLQDADMVINYDIHWNPVRIIQRMGRIDRLGSPNSKIFGINFWPSNNINTYLNLQQRIEQRMAAMKLGGAEVDESFSETFAEMVRDESLDQRMTNRMLSQMQISFDDLEADETFGFDDLSLERYRQDLFEEYNRDKLKYQRMPKGVFTGFKANSQICSEEGLIALLGYPSRPSKSLTHEYKVFDLIYINKNGDSVMLNQKDVLNALAYHKGQYRFIPEAIDSGDEKEIGDLVNAIKSWLSTQATEEVIQEDGSIKKVMGKTAKDLLTKLRTGDKNALNDLKQNMKLEEKFQLDKFDLITWFLITV
ncbi:SNF2-related protein [Chryseobacterium sp. G0201]|uniref:SNF2-related protein n=1 Tax=Chryseobacterium sp. G0201 TaxID=2487065 RepID=UPI000F4F0A4A|nr:SNF2-related protein [Chryseobacterium sp. G0201]AZA54590.1 helicase [Chryseobacterium sp. G0201]